MVVVSLVLGSALTQTVFAEPPTSEQALQLTPIQSNIDFAKPTKEEVGQCTIRAEKEGGATAWIVRNGGGEPLRRFADTNGDNIVDLWCYYLEGIEVYRDIDSNFNGKADQYRWLNSSGTRWGIDGNEDGRIDSWKMISPHEVAEELVYSLKTRDPSRFNLLLLSQQELGELGLGKKRAADIASAIQAAGTDFAKLATDQKIITVQSRYVDFGSTRPAMIPAGTEGSTKDLVGYDNASALVQTDGKNEQVFLGALVRVGDGWKLVGLPTVGSENQSSTEGFLLASSARSDSAGASAAGAPTEQMEKLMAELEQIDRQSSGLSSEQQTKLTEQRAALLIQLAEVTPDAEVRDNWNRQLADMLSVAVQSGGFPQGLDQLDQLEKRLADQGGNEELVAHARFQRMWANYVLSQQQPDADAAKIQEKWLTDLQEFIGQHPKSGDAAEALLQLGMYHEFVGKNEESQKWYQQLVSGFPNSTQTSKASGALRRLTSIGKPIPLKGTATQGGTVDLASAPYRGKLVLIQYWATWCEPCKQDMILLKDFYAKNANRGFEILGVCLGDNPDAAKQFLTENRFPWKQIYEPGGLDGALANEMGVMTLPLMILVDQNGNVVSDNIHVAELEAELKRLVK
jgi:thiol-disulfide isomerase/thioredoxin